MRKYSQHPTQVLAERVAFRPVLGVLPDDDQVLS
jgi:hypothetical protein